MLTVTFSNRFETLLAIFLERADNLSASPFEAEEIIVPSAAVRRKLELALADRRGICANVNFSFLGSWVLEQSLPTASIPAFSTDVLAWQIFRILCNEEFISLHGRLSSWLSKMQSVVMRLELAQRLAPLFEQYALYRPEWLHAWASGKSTFIVEKGTVEEQDQAWQAALWQRIANNLGTHPWVQLYELQSSETAAAASRSTVHVFCPTAIAPLYIKSLNRLGKSMDVQLYLLNPCREFWFDIVDPRRLSYLKSQNQADYQESGNSLLAAWGKQTQSMLNLMFEDNELSSHESSHFLANYEHNQPNTLLAEIQDAILDLQELKTNSFVHSEADRSLEVHVCHSMARELEVLQDQLLAAFASDTTLQPDDVLVVTPDLEQAAPFIDAIFGTAQFDRRIPYSISGRKASRENPAAKTLLDMLALISSRFLASEIFDLLRQPIVARKFGLKETDLNQIHDWMHESGIRWGLSAAHRKEFSLPESERHSFRDGLHRLFLAYALPSEAGIPFSNRLPASNPEGSQTAALGSFWDFMQQLEELQACLKTPQTPEQWLRTLNELDQQFMLPINNELDDLRDMRHKIRELCDAMQQGCGSQPVSLEVIQKALADHLNNTAGATIPTGMVTFSSMNSLRNLPYQMICVIGLNDGAFPSKQRPAEFDLMAKRFQTGDRQRRDDERNLFLDLLLAARERLYLSYTGRSVRDNEKMPPSVLISDLLDYVLPAIALNRSEAEKRLIIEHPLQPFSLHTYLENSDNRIISSRKEYFDALTAKQEARKHAQLEILTEAFEDEGEEMLMAEYAQTFFPEALSPPDEAWRDVSLDQLVQFFRNPSRYLLQHRLGIRFPEQPEELADEEPFLPEWEERNELVNRLLPQILSGATMSDIEIYAKAGSEYPPGKLGEALLSQEVTAMFSYADDWQAISAQPILPSESKTLTFEIGDESWQLSSNFKDLRPEGLMRYRFAKTSANDYLTGWINHLFLNATAPEGVACHTIWLSRDGLYKLKPVGNARALLQQLLHLYRRGLSTPLPFYPKSAWAYASGNWKLSKAAEKWKNNWNEDFGENRQLDFKQALRGPADPLGEDFEACAKQVFAPLLQYIEDDRLKISEESKA